MPEDYTLVEGLLQAVPEDRHFLASITLKSPVAPAITQLPVTLNILYAVHPCIFSMSDDQARNVLAPAKQLVAPEPTLLKQVLAAAALGATSSNGG